MNLPGDIVEFVTEHYLHETAEVLKLLEQARLHDGSVPDARTLRCALYNAGGTIKSLRFQLHGLKIDFRDVIVQAECRQSGDDIVRVRDFSQPISITQRIAE